MFRFSIRYLIFATALTALWFAAYANSREVERRLAERIERERQVLLTR
jgi:hypothetical protein